MKITIETASKVISIILNNVYGCTNISCFHSEILESYSFLVQAYGECLLFISLNHLIWITFSLRNYFINELQFLIVCFKHQATNDLHSTNSYNAVTHSISNFSEFTNFVVILDLAKFTITFRYLIH